MLLTRRTITSKYTLDVDRELLWTKNVGPLKVLIRRFTFLNHKILFQL